MSLADTVRPGEQRPTLSPHQTLCGAGRHPLLQGVHPRRTPAPQSVRVAPVSHARARAVRRGIVPESVLGGVPL